MNSLDAYCKRPCSSEYIYFYAQRDADSDWQISTSGRLKTPRRRRLFHGSFVTSRVLRLFLYKSLMNFGSRCNRTQCNGTRDKMSTTAPLCSWDTIHTHTYHTNIRIQSSRMGTDGRLWAISRIQVISATITNPPLLSDHLMITNIVWFGTGEEMRLRVALACDATPVTRV